MTLNKRLLALVIIGFVGLSGCSDEKEEGLADANTSMGVNDASTGTYGNDSSFGGNRFGNNSGGFGNKNGKKGRHGTENLGPEFSDPSNPLSKQTVYFMLDSSQVQPEFVPVIAAHSRYLVFHPNQGIVLEGNTDERGSREYNIALGDQRAKSVAGMMKAQGVADSQIAVVSYGEEKPVALEHDETSWELNRRVEIVYQ